MSARFSVRTLQLLCFLAGTAYLFLGEWSWKSLVGMMIAYTFIFVLGVAIGLHRGLSHRLVDPDSKLGWLTLGFGTLSSLGRPVEWALVHRMHHPNSDQESDPHSPIQQGFWKVLLNLWHLPESSKPRLSLIRDLMTARSVQFYQKYYYAVIAGYVVLLAAAFGLPGVIFGYCWPAVMSVLGASMVNAVCHRDGEAKDSLWVSLLTFGEGIHGRHHREPKTVNLSHGVYFDPSGWLLAKWTQAQEEGEVSWALRQRKQK